MLTHRNSIKYWVCQILFAPNLNQNPPQLRTANIDYGTLKQMFSVIKEIVVP